MTDTTYEGWTNRATWCVALWLNNDGEALYVEAYKAATAGEDGMRELVEQLVYGDEAPATLATDLLGDALASVDWRELVAAFAPDVTVDCAECAAFSGLSDCQDDECGCSVCEGVRADRTGQVPT